MIYSRPEEGWRQQYLDLSHGAKNIRIWGRGVFFFQANLPGKCGRQMWQGNLPGQSSRQNPRCTHRFWQNRCVAAGKVPLKAAQATEVGIWGGGHFFFSGRQICQANVAGKSARPIVQAKSSVYTSILAESLRSCRKGASQSGPGN